MAKRMVTGSTPKTTGTIIAISFLPPASMIRRRPSSRTSCAWARSTSASGVPRSTATTMPSTKRANEARPVGQPLQGGRQAGPGAGVGEAASELVGQLAVGQPHDPLERTGRAFACTHREREQLGDGGELGEHSGLTPVGLTAEQRVARDDADGEAEDDEHQQEEG